MTTETGGQFLNDLDTGAVSLSTSGSASLTLFTTDFGLVQEGATYTVTIAFIDGTEEI